MFKNLKWLPLFLIISVSTLTACHRDTTFDDNSNQAATNIIKVEPQNLVSTLYFSGNLLPYQQVSVISPNDGVVTAQNFQYGQSVQQNQQLFIIDSSKQASDFEQALTGYLKAKETLSTSQGSLQNTSMLYDKGLVSRNDFIQARSQYYTNELAYLQAQQQLQQAVKFYKTNVDIFSLSISDIHQIGKELHESDEIKNITVNSPAAGIALFPIAGSDGGSSSGNNGSQKVTIGSEVKQGQLLLTIGHSDSLKMKVQANQVDINQLKVGLPATITSMAFPNVTLQGYIANIDAQASSDSNSMPVFNMDIVIPKLSDQAKQVVKIGMSGKAAVDISQPGKIVIPISAVTQVNGNPAVTKMVKGKPTTVMIQTGKTTPDSVVVTAGLQAGDEIVASH